MGAVARRLGQGDLERRRLRRAVALPARLVMHQQPEAPHERMLRRQPGDQPLEQHRRAVQHLLGGVGAGEQLEPALERRRQDDGLARVGAAAEGAVELDQQAFAEAPRQAGARQVEQVVEAAQAHALQRLPMLAPGAEQPDRRRLEGEPGGGEVGALRRRLDPRQDRRALRRRRAGGVHAVAERASAAPIAWRSRSRPPK